MCGTNQVKKNITNIVAKHSRLRSVPLSKRSWPSISDRVTGRCRSASGCDDDNEEGAEEEEADEELGREEGNVL